MTDHEVRPLAESEFRAASTLFLGTLHRSPAADKHWERSKTRYEPGRVFGAFLDGELSGTVMSMPSTMVVPGGKSVPAAMVTAVGVRADRTRRGLLRSMMRAQLADVRERGETTAILHASETMIYERFGYGSATRSRRVWFRTASSALRDGVPGGGSVRMVDPETAETLLPEVYERLDSRRPGSIGRPAAWWTTVLSYVLDSTQRIAVHHDAEGVPDGFVIYDVEVNDHRFDNGHITVKVSDLRGSDAVAIAELWRFVLNLDLVDTVVAADRPVDELVEWMLRDARQCRTEALEDDLWVRLVDVPAALAARSYGGREPITVRVHDPLLSENSGTFRIGAQGVERCSDDPQLELDVAALGALYLGDVLVSHLVAANRVQVHDPSVLAVADEVFATVAVPWCGTGF